MCLHLNSQLNLSAKVNNLFDREYETFGTYGEADEVLDGFYPDVEVHTLLVLLDQDRYLLVLIISSNNERIFTLIG